MLILHFIWASEAGWEAGGDDLRRVVLRLRDDSHVVVAVADALHEKGRILSDVGSHDFCKGITDYKSL